MAYIILYFVVVLKQRTIPLQLYLHSTVTGIKIKAFLVAFIPVGNDPLDQ